MPELIVTNLNRNFTGVSATAAAVTAAHSAQYDLMLAGVDLPNMVASPMKDAREKSRHPSRDRPFVIWHVRRNPEMRHAIWARDVLRHPIKIVFTSAAIRRHSAYPRWLISKMDAVIATSQAAADFVPHVRAIVPHGVDCDRFTPARARAAAWAQTGFPGKRGIASIGRIRPEKGSDHFVEAMIKLLPHQADLTALVIGRASRSDQGFVDQLKSKIAEAGLTDRFVFTGEMPTTDMPALLRGLSGLVQLPRYEGYGMVPLEAMASGVPFVATDTGAYKQFAQNRQAGFIVTPSEAPDAITKMLEELPGLSKAARRLAKSDFSLRQEAQSIAELYETLWAEGHAPRA